MTLEEAIKHAEEVAKEQDKLCKRYDDASGYTRSHNKDIRTTDAKRCEECAEEHKQLVEWLKDYKRLLEQQPCDDAISREDTLKAIIKNLGIRSKEYLLEAEKAVYKTVENMPPVTPQQKVGHWIDREIYDADRWKCSECGRTEQYKENYCPNCGCRMIEPQESEVEE